MSLAPRFLGVTTLSPFFQVEGVEPVLDRLQAVGVNAVAIYTSVTVTGTTTVTAAPTGTVMITQ